LYAVWDDIFYPDGVGAWLAKLDTDPGAGGLSADPRFFLTGTRSAGCGSTRPGCKAGTPPATRTASPGSDSMLYAMDAAAGSPPAVVLPGLVAAAAGLLAAATVAGAWLAWRRPGQQQVWFGAAAGALLVIAGLHVLPDAWSAARAARIWQWAVPAAAIATFLLAG